MVSSNPAKGIHAVKIGILAVQGDFAAHAAMLAGMAIETVEVRTPAALESCDGLILPGGESTTQLQFLQEEGLYEAIKKFAAEGKAIFGTCAGAILLATEVKNPQQESLGLLDMTVLRNGYGRPREAAAPRAAILADLVQRLDDQRVLPDALGHRRQLARLDLLGQLGRLPERPGELRSVGDDFGAFQLADKGALALRQRPRGGDEADGGHHQSDRASGSEHAHDAFPLHSGSTWGAILPQRGPYRPWSLTTPGETDTFRTTLVNSGPPADLSRRHLLQLGGAAMAAHALVPEVVAAQETPRRGGVFRLRGEEPTSGLDPHLVVNHHRIATNLSFTHSRLVKVKAGPSVVPGTQPLEPDLAESWSQPNDRTYVFKLRKGVRWHPKPPVNGRELTAEDVKYTYDRFLQLKGNPNRSTLSPVERIDVLDRSTVKFTLTEPFGWFLDYLANTVTWIVPREAVEHFGDLRRAEACIGTGPWILERYEPNTRLTFVRHKDYFIHGLPYADGVEVAVDEDPSSRLASWLAGRY